MQRFKRRLSYSNLVATLSLFIALGGASYAAVQIPKSSIGSRQLRNGAVSTNKLRNGAVTAEKIANGSIDGSKLNLQALGTVPSSASAARADEATHAAQASHSESANIATTAEEAKLFGGLPANAYGIALMANTEIPATANDAVVWIPVNGIGQVGQTFKEVSMFTPDTEPLYLSAFSVFSWTGPAAPSNVEIELYCFGEPLGHTLHVHPLVYHSFDLRNHQVKIPAGGMLAFKVFEEPIGGEIPAFSIQTSLMLSPSP